MPATLERVGECDLSRWESVGSMQRESWVGSRQAPP